MQTELTLLYEDEFGAEVNEVQCIKQICETLDRTMIPIIQKTFEKVPTNHKRGLINKIFSFFKDN